MSTLTLTRKARPIRWGKVLRETLAYIAILIALGVTLMPLI